MEAKGKILLKSVGILMIINGAIAIGSIVYAINLYTSTFMEKTGFQMPFAKEWIIILSVIASIRTLIQVLAGICGVRNCNNLGAANLCIGYGIALLIAASISIILGQAAVLTGSFPFYAAPPNIGTFFLPILLIIGATQNKKPTVSNESNPDR